MGKSQEQTMVLSRAETKTIAFVSESVIPLFDVEFLMGISQFTDKHRNYSIRYINAKDLGDKATLSDCDGFIVNFLGDGRLDLIRSVGAPIVDIFNEFRTPGIINVDADNDAVGTIAAKWFLGRGFRNFAYCGVHGIEVVSDLCEAAFAKAVQKAGLKCDIFDIEAFAKARYSTNMSCGTILRALKAWIPSLLPRTAVLCINDRRAQTLMEACLDLGRAVPEDIAIMGMFNDISLCACAPISITSIDFNIRRQGYAAMRLLASAVEHPVAPKLRPALLIRPKGIVERASTNVYPVDPPWLADALLLLDANIGRQVSAKDLANAAGVSQASLQTAIHKAFGMSANKYILSVKMREAKRLVESGKYSVKEIAARTGFSSSSYFSRTFTAYFGRPPSSERRS